MRPMPLPMPLPLPLLGVLLAVTTVARADVVISMPSPPATQRAVATVAPAGTTFATYQNERDESDRRATGRLAMSRYAFARKAPRPYVRPGRPLVFWYTSVPGYGGYPYGFGRHGFHGYGYGYGYPGYGYGYGHGFGHPFFFGHFHFGHFSGSRGGDGASPVIVPPSSFRSTP